MITVYRLILFVLVFATAWLTAQPLPHEQPYREQVQAQVVQQMVAGDSLQQRRNHPGALRAYLAAFELAQQLPDTADENWKLYTSLGRMMSEMRSYGLALTFARRAYQIVQQKKTVGVQSHYLRVGFIASIFLKMNLLDSAEFYFRKAIVLATPLERKVFLAAAHNNLGMLLARRNNPEALISYVYAQNILHSFNIKDPIEISILDNIADYFIQRKSWKEGLIRCNNMYSWLQENSSLLRPDEIAARTLQINLRESQCLMGLKQWARAAALLQKLNNSPVFIQNIDFQLQKARLQSELFASTGQNAQAFEAQQQVAALLDTLYHRQQQFTTIAADGLASIQTQPLQRAMENAELRARQQSLLAAQEARNARLNVWVSSLVGLIALLLLAGGYVLSRRRILLKQQQVALEKTRRELAQIQLQKEQAENEALSLSLEHRQRDLSSLLMYMSGVREWQTRLQTMLEGGGNEATMEQNVRTIRRELHNLLAVDERQQLIHDNFEILNNTFFTRLANQYPTLTKAEIELCGYLRLNLSTKDIATLKNVTPKAIEMGRYRLRKKMNLGGDVNISAKLQEI